jgi:hypothetical protein
MDPSVAVAWITVIGMVAAGVFSVGTTVHARRQSRQQEDIDALALLVHHFLPRWEVEHLDKLYRRQPLRYYLNEVKKFPDEVRHLRDLSLIEPHRSEFHVGDLPVQGDLRDYFRLTADGEKLMKLREKFATKR